MEESPYIIKNKLKNKEIEGEDRILFELKICEFLKKAENLQYRPSDEFLKTKLAILK